ncbi:MAG: hypothetical protein JW809_05425 [Pirellulales bacterium]|nr:hypothetical protein [Pirellulales bacterium]
MTLLVVANTGRGAAEDVYPLAARAVADYRAAMEELAAWCDQKGLADEARQTRDWHKPRDPNKVYVAILPDRLGTLAPPEGAAGDALEWHHRFARLRQDQAKALFGLARRAARSGAPSLAVELAMAAIHEDPDHDGVRRLLGYQAYEGGWRTGYEVRRLRAGYVWSDRFGWIRRDDLPRYEAGERRHKDRWITAEEDERLHRDIHNGWDIQTEHYTVRTNHGIEAGVALGVKLEQLYRVWNQLFLYYYANESQLASLFDGRGRQPAPPRHHVVLFRDRDDYNQSLRPAISNIEISVGLYSDQTRRAYFFAGKDHDERTLYHEATHQLFHESRPVALGVGRQANFWIVEGIALYMESLHAEDGYHVLGGFDDVRMRAARYRLLHDRFFVPWEELTAYGLDRLQADPRIATLYSQMAGMTHFLVHGRDARYRDALVRYLAAVYQGSQDPALLPKLTGVPYAELDRQYREFIAQGVKEDAAPSE